MQLKWASLMNYEEINLKDAPSLPLSGEVAEKFLREKERKVLDLYHTKSAFWSIPSNKAFCSLLMAIDSNLLTCAMLIDTAKQEDSVGVWQCMKLLHHGSAVAVRWLYEKVDPKNFLLPTCDDAKYIDDAGMWLLHAIDYALLEIFHISYGFGIYDVFADKESSTIRFLYKDSLKSRTPFFFADLIEPRRKNLSYPKSSSLSALDNFLSKNTPEASNGRITLRWIVNILSSDVIKSIFNEKQAWDIIDIPNESDFGDFSYSQFKDYWRVLRSWSILAARSYLSLVANGLSQSECMPTQFVPINLFRSQIAEKSKLSLPVVDKITNLLTYSSDHNKQDPFLQPLFKIGNTIAWSSFIVTLIAQPRNLLKLLSRTPDKKDIAAFINGTRERKMLNYFGKRLQKFMGYDYKLNTSIAVANDKTEIDLLAYRKKVPNEVLIVQGKATIAADDPHEIMSVTKELLNASRQCIQSENILRQMPIEQKKQLFPFVDWIKINSYYHLALSPDSEPNGHYVNSEVPNVTLLTLENRLKGQFLKSPRNIYLACKERPWLQYLNGADKLSIIKIDDVKYELPYTKFI